MISGLKNLVSLVLSDKLSRSIALLMDRIFFFASLFYLGLVLLGIRLEKIIGLGDAMSYKIYFFKGLCLFSWFCLWRYRRSVAIYMLFFALFALGHAFACIYQPSLRFGVPVLDYMLSPHVSANWTFGLAKDYLWHIIGNLCLAMTVVFYVGSDRQKYLHWLCRLVLLGFLANLLVAAVQYFYAFSFLAQGSGSAVAAKRFSGLLEDSAAASLFLIFCYGGLLFYRQKNPRIFISILKWTVIVFLFFLGAFGSGRLFLISVTAVTALWIMLQVFSALWARKWRQLMFVLLAASAGLSGILYVTSGRFDKDREIAFARKLTRVIADTQLSARGISRLYMYVIRGRDLHMRVMSEATDHYFPTGSGMGTFVANQDNYKAHNHTARILSDWPSSFYLLMTSEWGLSGFLVLAFICMLFIGGITRYVVDASCNFKGDILNSSLTLFSLGALGTLLLAWVVGIHFVFPSIGFLIGLIISALYSFLVQIKGWARAIHFVAVSILLSFMFSIGLLYVEAPERISSFKWLEKRSPQIPLIYKENLKGVEGSWLAPYGEYIATSDVLKFYVKHPPEYYPVEVTVRLRGVEDEVLAEKRVVVESEGWQSMQFPVFLSKGCGEFTPSKYCIYHLSADKLWQWEKRDMLVFIPDASQDD